SGPRPRRRHPERQHGPRRRNAGDDEDVLILWMMHENARAHGTKSLYVSLEQDMDSLKAGAARMGMGNLHESSVYILDMGQLRRGLHRSEGTKDWFTIIIEIVNEAVNSSGYQVLAIDSLE